MIPYIWDGIQQIQQKVTISCLCKLMRVSDVCVWVRFLSGKRKKRQKLCPERTYKTIKLLIIIYIYIYMLVGSCVIQTLFYFILQDFQRERESPSPIGRRLSLSHSYSSSSQASIECRWHEPQNSSDTRPPARCRQMPG